tara:strand:+ start:53 stop:919 length:867 start_codon:yes stop_codon:yes gene_type:complete
VSIKSAGVILISLLISPVSQAKSRIPPIEESLISKVSIEPQSPIELARVLVWNTHKEVDGPWEEDFLRISDGKNIILLQEALQNDLSESLVKQLHNYDIHFGISFINGDGEGTGVANITQGLTNNIVPIRSQGKEPGSINVGIGGTPKMSFYQAVQLANGKSLSIVNIHALNSASNEKYQEQIKDALEHVDCDSGPAIVAGDFNTLPHNLFTGGDRKPFLFGFMEEKGLKMVDFGDQTADMAVDYPGGVNAGVLDYAFVCGAEVVQPKVYGDVNSSDHKPFGFSLRFY